MKTLTAVFLAACFLTTASANGITVGFDPLTPTGPFIPGTTNNVLAVIDVFNPAAETLNLSGMNINLDVTGVLVKNLELWTDGTYVYELGTIISSPGPTDGFTFPYVVGSDASVEFQIRGDVTDGPGSIQISIPVGGVTGNGFDDSAPYSGPNSLITGPTLEVENTPEPKTGAMVIGATALLAVVTACKRKRETV